MLRRVMMAGPTAHRLWKATDLAGGVGVVLDDEGAVTDVSGYASVWRDVSGNSRDGTQGVSAARPLIVAPGLNGKRVLRFDGADAMAISSANNLYRNVTSGWMLTVYNNDFDASAIERPILFFTNNAALTRVGCYAGTPTSGANKYSGGGRRLDSDSYYGNNLSTARSASWTVALTLLDYAARTITTHVNGAVEATATGQFTASGATSNTASNGVYIGRNNANNTFYKGDIAALVCGVSLPSGVEIDKLFGAYMWRYGLEGNLPTDHPYKGAPPYV